MGSGTTKISRRLELILQILIKIEEGCSTLDFEDYRWLCDQYASREGDDAQAIYNLLETLKMSREGLSPDQIRGLKQYLVELQDSKQNDSSEDQLPLTASA